MTKTVAHSAMLTVAEIAERDEISRPSVSGIVKRLVEQYDLAVERDARGRVARVNVAQYDRLRGRPGADGRPTSDAAKAYAEARAEKTKHEAERARLQLEEISGRMVAREGVTYAAHEAIVCMGAAFDLAVNEMAEDLAHLSGIAPGVIRTRLRAMKERAVAAYRQGLTVITSAGPGKVVTGMGAGIEGLVITATQPLAEIAPTPSDVPPV